MKYLLIGVLRGFGLCCAAAGVLVVMYGFWGVTEYLVADLGPVGWIFGGCFLLLMAWAAVLTIGSINVYMRETREHREIQRSAKLTYLTDKMKGAIDDHRPH